MVILLIFIFPTHKNFPIYEISNLFIITCGYMQSNCIDSKRQSQEDGWYTFEALYLTTYTKFVSYLNFAIKTYNSFYTNSFYFIIYEKA